MGETSGAPDWLLGRWRLHSAEPGVEMMPGTGMEFGADGLLTYRIHLEERDHLFELHFSVEGNLLRTYHPGNGQQQAVRFGRDASGMLELDFQGARAWFARVALM